MPRRHGQLDLDTTLKPALMAVKGHAAPELERTYSRARALAEDLDDPHLLFPVLRGQWVFHLLRAELDRCRELGLRCLRLAERVRDPGLLVEAYRALGVTCFFRGDFKLARDYLDRGIATYEPERDHVLRFRYGHDPGLVCLADGSVTLWLLGEADRARAHASPHPTGFASWPMRTVTRGSASKGSAPFLTLSAGSSRPANASAKQNRIDCAPSCC